MQTLPPSVDRLGAALRALRQVHAREGEDKTLLGAQCLHVVIAQLAEEGLSQEDLQPLIDLEASLHRPMAHSHAEGGRVANRRKSRPPSEALLGRAAAVIDLLVKAGYDESEAAQVFMRRLLAAGVPPPQHGGDARGWKRLLARRADLNHGVGSHEALDEYQEFTREIEAIPANERLKRVLDEQLWDRRRKARG